MGKKYIITENQYKLMFEQGETNYKPLDYLRGKTINLYYDESNSKIFLANMEIFNSFYYHVNRDSFISIREKYSITGPSYLVKFRCNYSTNLVDGLEVYESDYKGNKSGILIGVFFNKKLIDEINLKKIIKCTKPAADYSSVNNSELNKTS